MPNSSRMQWPYPAKDVDPWFDTFEAMIDAMDSSSYSSREDRDIIFGGGGNVSWNATSGLLSWSSDIVLYSMISGFKLSVLAGNVTLLAGQVLYVDVTRSPLQNLTLIANVANSVPNTDTALILAVRSVNTIYWKWGSKIEDGETINLFSASVSPDASDTVKGITKLSVAPVSATNPIAVGDNDERICVNRRIIYTISQPGDGSDFNVPISPAMPSVNYIVTHSLATVSFHVTMAIPEAGRATGQFNVKTSAPLANGDTIFFHVVSLNAGGV